MAVLCCLRPHLSNESNIPPPPFTFLFAFVCLFVCFILVRFLFSVFPSLSVWLNRWIILIGLSCVTFNHQVRRRRRKVGSRLPLVFISSRRIDLRPAGNYWLIHLFSADPQRIDWTTAIRLIAAGSHVKSKSGVETMSALYDIYWLGCLIVAAAELIHR